MGDWGGPEGLSGAEEDLGGLRGTEGDCELYLATEALLRYIGL